MAAIRAYHIPQGSPCALCGLSAVRHFVEHEPQGDPCKLCILPPANHRARERERIDDRGYRNRSGRKYSPEHNSRPSKTRYTDRERLTYIGIDGEGVGRKEHNYILLAASKEDGSQTWSVTANPRIGRLTTRECLDMILELPTRHSKIFSYAFNYDITKIITDLPNKLIYQLFRPNLPERKRPGNFKFQNGPLPVEWEDYKLNLQGTKFTVQCALTGKKVVIWDLIKFFQSKFVPALEAWKVGSPELWKRMAAMKDRRAVFDLKAMPEIEAYCLEETECMAQLARKLVESHESAGLTLRSYYGAGSSGQAMLTAMNIKEKLAPPLIEMREAVASAFFGGRFENSVIGAIHEPLQGWDISSAYVYQLAFLPCLEHASWQHTTKRKDLEKAEAQNGALVRYTLGPNPGIESWGPFPFRSATGSISFPIESGGGWIWLDEFLAGERIFPHVQFQEAWVYSSNCNCKPFGQIPEYYNLRLKIGKEGPGIVIKLGMNSCYGKLAQSLGKPVFQSWIWAGMITSGCRAQILQMMALHKDMSNLLMIATDGIITREKLTPPVPLFTGTGTEKPLGGWEHKAHDKGMFFARPGIYFPLMPTEEEIKQVRARVVGRSVVLRCWESIIDAWEKDGVSTPAIVDDVTRFCGAKTCISMSGKPGKRRYTRANGKQKRGKNQMREGHLLPSYGQWITRPVKLGFDPKPKRELVRPDGVTLELRKFPRDLVSRPYRKATVVKSAEAMELEAAKQELLEQPDADLEDYEEETGNV